MPNQKIKIPFSEQELQDLMDGGLFEWTFPTDGGEDIDVTLFKGKEEGNDEEDGDDGLTTFICKNCGRREYWNAETMEQKGEPVCPNDDEDMVIQKDE